MSDKDQSRLSLLLMPLRQQEQQARQDFLLARHLVEDLEADVARCRIALASQDAWAGDAVRAGGAAELAFYRQCVAELGEELARKRDELASARAKLQARRQELARRMKQRKAMERLLRRQEVQAASDALRKETSGQDHLYAAQSAWRMENDGGGQPRVHDHDAN